MQAHMRAYLGKKRANERYREWVMAALLCKVQARVRGVLARSRWQKRRLAALTKRCATSVAAAMRGTMSRRRVAQIRSGVSDNRRNEVGGGMRRKRSISQTKPRYSFWVILEEEFKSVASISCVFVYASFKNNSWKCWTHHNHCHRHPTIHQMTGVSDAGAAHVARLRRSRVRAMLEARSLPEEHCGGQVPRKARIEGPNRARSLAPATSEAGQNNEHVCREM